MADNSFALDEWLLPLLTQLQPGEVRRLARTLAADLRRRQAARIEMQKSPDGSPYAPRRTRPRRVGGPQRTERERVLGMFAKLRTNAHLKARSSVDEASVCIEGRSARIAQVHQFGLIDRPQAGGPQVRYPARALLGWSDDDLAALHDKLVQHLTR